MSGSTGESSLAGSNVPDHAAPELGDGRGRAGGTVIEPKVVTMPLPHERDWLWYPDLNIVALAPHLDEAGRWRAIDELQAEWRSSLGRHLVAVPAAPSKPGPMQTAMSAVVLVPVLDLPVLDLPASAV